MNQQATASLAIRRARKTLRGLRSGRVSHDENAVTREIQWLAYGTQLAEDMHPSASVKTELMGISYWKSEGPVVAMKSGNSDGAKGFWFRIAEQRHRDRTPSRDNP